MLQLDKVSIAYGRATAVRDVSLVVNDGEIVTLIGANGAGKTSLLNAISGIVPVRNGSIWLDEHQLSGLRSHESVNLGIGYVP